MLGINQLLLAMLSYLPIGLLPHAVTRFLQISSGRQCSSLVDTTRGFRNALRFVCGVALSERVDIFLIRERDVMLQEDWHRSIRTATGMLPLMPASISKRNEICMLIEKETHAQLYTLSYIHSLILPPFFWFFIIMIYSCMCADLLVENGSVNSEI